MLVFLTTQFYVYFIKCYALKFAIIIQLMIELIHNVSFLSVLVAIITKFYRNLYIRGLCLSIPIYFSTFITQYLKQFHSKTVIN